jgi:membrane protein DedA with SNARE-associated domain
MWDELIRLIPDHGYAVTMLGALLEGETILVLAGLASNRGYLALPNLMVIGAIGGFLGDQFYFAIGRHHGARVLARFPSIGKHAARAASLIERYPELSIVSVRYMYGLRIVGPIMIGMSRIGWVHYAALNALGAILWSVTWVGVGYLAGSAIEALLGNLKRVEHVLFAIALVVVVVATIALHWYRRHSDNNADAGKKDAVD